MKRSFTLLLFCIMFVMSIFYVAEGQTTKNFLSSSGGKLLDAAGNQVRLTGVNWFGFETAQMSPHGLWSRDCKSMLMQMKDQGFNCVRLPWTNAMLRAGKTIQISANGTDPYTGRSPMNQLESTFTTPLQLLDQIIKYCQELNLKVILDCHARQPDNYLAETIWYDNTCTEQQWINDWTFLVSRYKDYDAFVASDLDNEPHGNASWGNSAPATDWNKAAERCGNAILAVNPNMLIFVEGIEFYQGAGYWWGGNFLGAQAFPIVLSKPSQLVYSPHEYGPTVFAQTWFNDPTFPTNMPGIWDKNFGYLQRTGTSHLFVGEFGIKQLGGKDEIWIKEFLKYMGSSYSWTFWCWNPNSGDTGGVLDDQWTNIVKWKVDMLKPYLAPIIPNGIINTVKFNITATTGTGGLISPAAITSVNQGASQVYTITPSSGFIINDVKVNGVSVGAVSTYTFTNVAANQTIAATFATKPMIPVTGVTISPLTATIALGASQQFTATVSPANATNKSVIWTSSNLSIGSVNSTGLAITCGLGTTTITAKTVDGNFVASATLTCTNTNIAVTGVTLTPASISLAAVGATSQLTATISPSNATSKSVTYASSNTAVATVSASGLVTAVANGSAVITVTTVDGAKTASSTVSVAVSTCTLLSRFAVPAASGLPSFTTPSQNYIFVLGTGGPDVSNLTTAAVQWDFTNNGLYQFAFNTKNGIPAWYTDLLAKVTNTFKSSSPACKITGSSLSGFDGDYWVNMDGSNFVMVEKTGKYAIYISATNVAPSTCNSAVPVTGVSLSPATATIALGSSQQFTPTISPSHATNKSVSYTSSNTAVGTVSPTGLVTACGVGTTTITVKTADGNFVASSTLTSTNTNIPVTGVTLSPATASINVGSSQQLSASVAPSNATNKAVSYTSNNSAVASVSSTGLVSGIAAGMATITVTTADGAKTATSTITVTNSPVVPVTGVAIAPTSITVGVNATSQLTASISPSNATNKNVSWTSSNTAIATVSTTGLVTGKAAGTANVTVTTADGNKTDICAVTVTSSSFSLKIEAESYNQMSGVQLETCTEGGQNVGYFDAGDWMTWAVTIPSTAVYTVSYRVASLNGGGSIQLDKDAGTTILGTIAVAATGGWQNWTTISQNITIPAGSYNLGFKAKAGGFNINWLSITSSGGPVAVTGVTLPTTASVLVNATAQLSATVAPELATNKSVTWKSANTAIATVDASGIVKGIALGTTIITVTTVDGAKTATCSVDVTNVQSNNVVANNGLLKISGNKVVNKNNQSVALGGVSLFWSNTGWGGEKYYNAGAINTMKNDWNVSIVRAAMGVNETGGYLTDASNKARVKAVVDAAIAAGIYVIIDWHCHTAQDYQAQAVAFFSEMAQTYGNTPNVIYEIFNEPLQVSWSGVIKPYANAVIAAIRAKDPDNIIIVGTPTWSQDVDAAANDPITGFSNIAYTCHFYAATHKQFLRDKVTYAMSKGCAIFVTEWGTCDASGNGSFDAASTNEWMTFLKNNGISHCNWSLNDKAETASILNPGASATGGWNDGNLTQSGLLVRNIIRDGGWAKSAAANTASSSEVYPNPSMDGNFTLSLQNYGKNEKVSIQITNLNGKVVYLREYANIGNKKNIHVLTNGSLASGLYLVKISTASTLVTKRLLITK